MVSSDINHKDLEKHQNEAKVGGKKKILIEILSPDWVFSSVFHGHGWVNCCIHRLNKRKGSLADTLLHTLQGAFGQWRRHMPLGDAHLRAFVERAQACWLVEKLDFVPSPPHPGTLVKNLYKGMQRPYSLNKWAKETKPGRLWGLSAQSVLIELKVLKHRISLKKYLQFTKRTKIWVHSKQFKK